MRGLLCEKAPNGVPDVFPSGQGIAVGGRFAFGEFLEQAAHLCVQAVTGAPRGLHITYEIADGREFLQPFPGSFPVGGEVVAVGGIKNVDVVLGRVESFVDDVERKGERSGCLGATGGAYREKFLFREFPGVYRVTDEGGFDSRVLAANTLQCPEKE